MLGMSWQKVVVLLVMIGFGVVLALVAMVVSTVTPDARTAGIALAASLISSGLTLVIPTDRKGNP